MVGTNEQFVVARERDLIEKLVKHESPSNLIELLDYYYDRDRIDMLSDDSLEMEDLLHCVILELNQKGAEPCSEPSAET